jgi:predicted RNA-binding protein
MGDVQCIFVEEESVVKNCIGKTVCFGEILGKHSEVVGKLEEEDLTVLTDDQHAIEIIEKYIGSSFGHNPIDIIIEKAGYI